VTSYKSADGSIALSALLPSTCHSPISSHNINVSAEHDIHTRTKYFKLTVPHRFAAGRLATCSVLLFLNLQFHQFPSRSGTVVLNSRFYRFLIINDADDWSEHLHSCDVRTKENLHRVHQLKHKVL
jgi:hypothetical protein